MLAGADKVENAMILNYLAAGLSIYWLHKINAAITKTLRSKQAAATHLELRVSTSVNKIANEVALYHCTISSYYIRLFMRKSWLWHVLLPRLISYFFGDSLQNAKQLFFCQAYFNDQILCLEGVW
jgi:hypothetical protein